MRSVDMAVVVSQSQNEIDDLKQKGLDILPHRERMQKEDLESKFKDADDPLRLVFVCAMWITGFDVPTCSTIYLDKPMKNHTLMQTIARANRRAPGKSAGVIVDYVGVFQNLQKALAIYAAKGSDSTPIRDKDELVAELEKALAEARAFCAAVGVDVDAIFAAEKLARLTLISQAVEALVAPDERRRGFLPRRWRGGARLQGAAAGRAGGSLSEAGGDPACPRRGHTRQARAGGHLGQSRPRSRRCWTRRSKAWRSPRRSSRATRRAAALTSPPSTSRSSPSCSPAGRRTAAEKLRSEAEAKAHDMAAHNPTRVHLVEKLEKLVEAYNLGTLGVEAFFEALKALVAEMEEEERRAAREGLTEDELAVFDLLTKPKPKLTKAQEVAVKKVARELLEKLQDQLAVAQWQSKQQTRAAVQSTIRFTLNELPEEPYPEPVWNEKVDAVWAFIFARRAAQSSALAR